MEYGWSLSEENGDEEIREEHTLRSGSGMCLLHIVDSVIYH